MLEILCLVAGLTTLVLVFCGIAGYAVYRLMRPREVLSAGAAETYQSAWNQLMRDHTESLTFLTRSSDAMLGMAGTITNNMAVLLDRQSAVIGRDYGQQALDMVRVLLNERISRERIPNPLPNLVPDIMDGALMDPPMSCPSQEPEVPDLRETTPPNEI